MWISKGIFKMPWVQHCDPEGIELKVQMHILIVHIHYIKSSPIPYTSRTNLCTCHTSLLSSYADRRCTDIFASISRNLSKYSKCRPFMWARNASTSYRGYISYARFGRHEHRGCAGVDSGHVLWCNLCPFKTQRWHVMTSKWDSGSRLTCLEWEMIRSLGIVPKDIDHIFFISFLDRYPVFVFLFRSFRCSG